MARPLVITAVFLVHAALGGCQCAGSGGAGGAGGRAAAQPGTPARAGGEDPEGPDGEHAADADRFARTLRQSRTELDLLALSHLADVDAGGLYIDFGTPARMKYTMGRYRNDWGEDGHAGDRTFTRLGGNAKVWVQLDRAEALTTRLRLRKVRATRLVVYANGEALQTLDLREGVQTYDVPVPAERLRAGENVFQLRATGIQSAGRRPVALEMDSMWLLRGDAGAPGEEIDEPRWDALVSEEALQGDTRRALSVNVGTRLSFYLEAPAEGTLAFSLGGRGAGARASVAVTPFDGDRQELFSGPVGASWTSHLAPLARWAGKVVRLDLTTEGAAGGRVYWGAPQVVVPLPEEARDLGRARNVIMLTIDTLRTSKLRPYNPHTRVRTPALDAFAADSVLFERAQAPENWTKPSVASILTSLSPMTHRTKTDAARLPDSALMVSEVFKAAGFTTATFLANGYVSDRFGFRQGWDYYTNYIREERDTSAHNVFGEAATWIEAHAGERFFVYIQTIDPHVPYDPPDEFLRMYDPHPERYTGQIRNRSTAQQLGDAKRNPPRITFSAADKQRLRDLHDGEISYHDRYLGTFLDRLRELGLYEDMIFVITSDHGEEFEEHGSWGHGHSVFQELLHVPLFVRWPAARDAGARIPQTVSTMDIAPTVLEASGVDVPEVFEGRSLLAYLRGRPRPGPALAFSEFLDDRRVIRAGRFKLIARGNLTWTMFDLQDDPGEQRQLDRRSANAIGLRYTRILLGQYLGARDRGDWMRPAGGPAARVLPQQDSQIDPQLCRQLRELGYLDARCDAP